MSDAKSLAAGRWQWTGWLTPKGRAIALFALLKFGDESVWLVLQDAAADEFAARLQRFVFRSKVKIEVRGDLQAAGRFGSGSAQASAMARNGDDVSLDFGASGGARALLLSSAPNARTDADALSRWTAFDLAHGLPRLAPSQSEQWTPQQLSLDRLGAYSVKKGCYPGQEIVARTHFLGQAKRGLALFESDAVLAPGAQVGDGDKALGSIVSAASADGRHLALAVLPLDAPAAGLRADDTNLRRVTLSDGLAR